MRVRGTQSWLMLTAAVAVGFSLLASSAVAEGPIARRKDRQQDRIAQGIRSGQLTPNETARIERREGALNREERAMRGLDGGKLTAGDRRLLNHQQNQLSRGIYRQKHDGQHS